MHANLADLIEDLVELEAEQFALTDWEANFVESVDQQHRAGKALSDKQANQIRRIHAMAFVTGRPS